MSIFRFIMRLEAHYICMVKHEFQYIALFHVMFGIHTKLFCHAVTVGNYNVKKVERQSASAYFTWDIT